MFLGVSTLTERGRQARAPEDQAEVRFLQHALRAVHRQDSELRMVVFTDPSTHDAFGEHERVLITGRRASFMGGRGRLVGDAARRAGVTTLLAPLSCPAPPHSGYSQLLFVTDLLFAGTGGDGVKSNGLPRAASRALRGSAGVVCTSQALQKQCTARLGLGLERIFVAPPGVSEAFQQPHGPLAERPYAVFLLNRYTQPCVPALKEALRKRPELFPPLLLIVGPYSGEEPEPWGCGTLRIERCPDGVLASLLHHADLLLYPAVEDGCGMAVVEALRTGTPVLTSRSGAAPEWGGNVPAYCEPQNATSIIQALRRFQDETPSEREERLTTGRGAASEATWERCAWKLLAALKHG